MTDADSLNINSLKNEFNKLLRKKALIEPEANEIKVRLDTINRQIAGLDYVLTSAGEDTAKIRKNIVLDIDIKQVEKPRKFPDIICEMLKNTSEPLHYKQITDILLRDTIPVPGQNPYYNVNAYLNRHKNLFAKAKEMGRGYYKLKE